MNVKEFLATIHQDRVIDHFYSFIASLESKGFTYWGSGDFRNVYIRGNCVIKVPYNYDGVIDCLTEARAYKLYGNNPTSEGYFLAPCRLLPNGCLMMPKVKLIYDEDLMPPWAEKIDNEQVGFHKERVVCYDYAINIPERHEWEKEWECLPTFFSTKDTDYGIYDEYDKEYT